MSELSDWKRAIYEPEKEQWDMAEKAYKDRIRDLEAQLANARAAMAVEAAQVVRNNSENVSSGDNTRYLAPRREGDLMATAYADAILALAPLPPGYVVVKVEDAEVLKATTERLKNWSNEVREEIRAMATRGHTQQTATGL